MFQRVLAAWLLIISFPLFFILYIFHLFFSSGNFFFIQKRMGKDKKVFLMYKITSMHPNADKKQRMYKKYNEADGPVFKIRYDPRFTSLGRVLSHTGVDELPQLINVMKGEMAFIGPRPLPVIEALKIPSKYHSRFSVLPGITSLWVIRGAHTLSFAQWMSYDIWYVKHRSLALDLSIFFLTLVLIPKMFFRLLRSAKNRYLFHRTGK